MQPGVGGCEIRLPIRRETDILIACQKGRALAARQGLSSDDQVIVVIAISELVNNIIQYAQVGEVILSAVQRDDGDAGIQVVAQDEGPGIPDIEQALQDGFSTGGGLGLGLSGARRMMDEFDIFSEVGRGTVVTMRKWSSKR
jgi:serine/threonine-protein kinase RsbT